jgi:hypothetical protein
MQQQRFNRALFVFCNFTRMMHSAPLPISRPRQQQPESPHLEIPSDLIRHCWDATGIKPGQKDTDQGPPQARNVEYQVQQKASE